MRADPMAGQVLPVAGRLGGHHAKELCDVAQAPKQ